MAIYLLLTARCFDLLESNKKKQSVNEVDEAIQKLQLLKRLTPFEAQRDPGLELAEKQFKKLSAKSASPKIELLRKELLAARLGIHAKEMPEDFASFAEQNRLYNYLAAYKHTLEVKESDIFIGPPEKRRPWSEVKNIIHELPKNEEWYKLCSYGEEGIQKPINLFSWKTLKPFKHGNPNEWGGGYAMELCTTVEEAPRFVGDHTFIRLFTPTGEIYSVGLYRPKKRSRLNIFGSPLRTQPGNLMSPDISEFWGCPVQSLTVAITKEAFDEKIKLIEQDKTEVLKFHSISDNCTNWALKVAKVSNITLDCKFKVGRVLAPAKVVKLHDSYFNKLPFLVQRVCRFAGTLFVNFIAYSLGSTKVDKKMEGETPHMSSFFDIFKAEKLLTESPYKLGTVIIPKINEWRRAELEKLTNAGEEEIAKVKWGLPKESFWENIP